MLKSIRTAEPTQERDQDEELFEFEQSEEAEGCTLFEEIDHHLAPHA
jgi:hypothetical protein